MSPGQSVKDRRRTKASSKKASLGQEGRRKNGKGEKSLLACLCKGEGVSNWTICDIIARNFLFVKINIISVVIPTRDPCALKITCLKHLNNGF